jgi:hypothetical protein
VKTSSLKNKNGSLLIYFPHTRPNTLGLFTALRTLKVALNSRGLNSDDLLVLIATDNRNHSEEISEFLSIEQINARVQTLSQFARARVLITKWYRKQVVTRLPRLPSGNIQWASTYVPKVLSALKFAESQGYANFLKCDEDVVLLTGAWNNLIGLATANGGLQSSSFYSVELSTGLPTWFDFGINYIPDFDDILRILHQTELPLKFLGLDYSGIAQSNPSGVWDEALYENSLAKLDHNHLGFHPIRFSAEACMEINLRAINRLDELLYIELDAPISFSDSSRYFCNNVFLTSTSEYKSLIKDFDLFEDPFDEIPLNIKIQRGTVRLQYLRNTPSLHFLYNHAHSQEVTFSSKTTSGIILEEALILYLCEKMDGLGI